LLHKPRYNGKGYFGHPRLNEIKQWTVTNQLSVLVCTYSVRGPFNESIKRALSILTVTFPLLNQ
jgi:hypothetical protein